MADLGTITGIFGAITGVIALIVSIKSYARVSAMKALDLRLEVEKAFNNLDVTLSDMDGFLNRSYQSHIRVLAATGRNQSGEMQLFEQEFQKDTTRLRGLLSTQPRREASYHAYSPSDLETVLTTLHAFAVQIVDLRTKYQRLLEADDERRKEIRAAH